MARTVAAQPVLATSDATIRVALLARLRREASRHSRTVIVNELGVLQGLARVDVAVINGSIHGYEIKSDRDTLVRLPGQVEAFSRVLDFVTVVASESHLRAVRDMVPTWWGLDVARPVGEELRISCVRSPERSPGLDPVALVQLLWRDEALALLSELGIANGLRTKPRRVLWARLTDAISPDRLAEVVRDALSERSEWRDPGVSR